MGALRHALTDLIEGARSRFVFRALDAFVTASLAPSITGKLGQAAFPPRGSHYRRVQRIASSLESLLPKSVARARKALIRDGRLPLSGYRAPETLGYGAACTVFRLSARGGYGGARQDVVLKVVRSSLGRGARAALAAGRAARERYQRMTRLYEGGDLVLHTSFLVAHAPLLGRPATVTIQPRIDRSARDFFLDFTDRQLLTAVRTNPGFAQQLRLFVTRTLESVRTSGRCLDLVGRGNVVVVASSDGPRIKIIDFGEIDLAEWARSKPNEEREARRRIARLERLSVPKGVNPRVEKTLWPR
jgi:hypothetical protein